MTRRWRQSSGRWLEGGWSTPGLPSGSAGAAALGLVLGIGCALATPMSVSARPEVTARRPVRLDRAVVDERHGAAYFPAPDGRLRAIRIATGEPLWQSERSLTPLLVIDEQLLAIASDPEPANAIILVALGIADGMPALALPSIELPLWVAIAPAPGRYFELRACSDGRAAVLDWQARSWYAGGARPSDKTLERESRHGEGRMELDLEGSAIRQVEVPKVTVPESLRSIRSAPYSTGESISEQLILADSHAAALSLRTTPGEQQLYLEVWDRNSGEPRLKTQIATGTSLRSMVSDDRQQLFVHDRWADDVTVIQAFSLANGRKLGSARVASSAPPIAAAVLGSSLYLAVDSSRRFDSERSLRAYDLDTGELRWSVPVWKPPWLPPAR